MREIAESYRERPFDDIKTAICNEFLLKYPDAEALVFYDRLVTQDKEFEALIYELNVVR